MSKHASGSFSDAAAALAAAFAAGRSQEVIAGARRLIRIDPAFGFAHKLLGCALHTEGHSAEAVVPLREAARLMPGDGQTFSNLGNALAGAERFGESIDAHREAIRLQPDNATVFYNMGCAYLAWGRKPEALEQFLLAYERSPQDADMARLCRELLLEIGDAASQADFCRMNLLHIPGDSAALAMLGALLLDAGDNDEAEALLRKAVGAMPENQAAWSNLSIAAGRKGKLMEAVDAARHAVILAPEWSTAHNNLGVALRDAGAWEEARNAFLRALRYDGDNADAWYNLGCTYVDLNESVLARGAFIEAVQREARPAWLLQGAHACRQAADWDGAELIEEALRTVLAEIGALERETLHRPAPFAFLTTPDTSAREQLRIAEHFAACFHGRAPVEEPGRHDRAPSAPLRVGLLSADFRDHATAHLMVGVLEALDPARFRLVAYDYGPPAADAYRGRLRRAIPEWVDVAALSDQEAARCMAADGIDIAIDLKGWTQGFRAGILAHRPAPVQMQWLGFPGSMGAPWIDYIIADAEVIPVGDEAGYSEKILRLSGCYQPNDRSREVGPQPARAELGLPQEALVLAAFHQPYKITREVFVLWLSLLRRAPNAVLWLLDAPPIVRDTLCQAATDAGVEASRLIWAPRMPAAAHLGRLAAADLALDAFPVNAHTTASDALWAGVPQAACRGDTFVSRVSASIVLAAGLPELVAESGAAYETLVVDLLERPDALAELRRRLIRNRLQCALFDDARFARCLGAGLEMAWQRHCDGLPADHLDVADPAIRA